MLFLAFTTVKATLVLVLAFALAFALRRASAAGRHLMWMFVLTCVLALPVLTLVLPRVPVNVRPVENSAQELTVTVSRAPALPSPRAAHDAEQFIFCTWLAGVLIVRVRSLPRSPANLGCDVPSVSLKATGPRYRWLGASCSR